MSTVKLGLKLFQILFIMSIHSCALNHSEVKCQYKSKSKKSDQSLNYRLPNNTLPIRYDLWIKTDIHKCDFIFSGRVSIHIKFLLESKTITMHARDIIIDKVDLYDKNGVLNKSNVKFKHVDVVDFLIVELASLFNVTNEIILEITYHGTMTNEMSGIYATSYQNEHFQSIWMLSTHFLPLHARKAFVCYDEPQIRAPIRLSIQHDKTYQAISNMRVSKIDTIIATDYVVTTFDETPPIQTYLLSFLVSNLSFMSNKNEQQFEQRIYGEPHKILDGSGSFAIKVVDDVLWKFRELLPIPLEITKIDHVQIPQMNGVLDHYGLIAYEENFLLLDDGFNKEERMFFEPQIIAIISHGLSHQYFGGIISPNWWQYLWLNEGFATFYQYYIPSLIYPQFNYMDKFLNEVLEYAFEIDIKQDTINDYVETPLQIQNKFNSIVFEKSATVIRMFHEALTPSTFTKGLIIFLNEMRFKAVDSDDFHQALQKAFDDDNPDENLNISRVISSWETQSGFPVVSVKTNGKNVILSQKRFSNNEDSNSSGGYSNNNKNIYSIPITFATRSSNSNFNKTLAYSWMTSQTLEINEILSTPDEWIILNIQQVGFYRVDYSKELWDAIITVYKTNFKIIHHTNRKVLHDEMFIAWKILKTKNASDCLKLLCVLEYEMSGDVWEKAAQYILPINDFLRFSDVHIHFQKLLHKVLQPHMDVLKGFDSGEKLSVEVRKWSRATLHPVYLQEEQNKLLRYMESDENAKPDFCSALRYANSSIYRHFIRQLIEFEVFVDLDIVTGLGCSMNVTLIYELFDAILNPLNKVSGFIITNAIYATTESSMIGLDAVMNLVIDKWSELDEITPNFIESLIDYIHSFINSPFQFKKFKNLTANLIKNKLFPPSKIVPMLKTIETKLKNEEWENIKQWFGLNGEQPTITSSTCQTETATLNACTFSTSIRIITICISLYILLK